MNNTDKTSKKYKWFEVTRHAMNGHHIGISTHTIEKYIEGELGKQFVEPLRKHEQHR